MPARRTLLHAGGLAGLACLAGCLAAPPYTAPTPTADDWLTTRRGPTNTACAPDATPPRERPAVAWRAVASGPVDELLVDADTVYATLPTETAALDRETGERRWTTAGEGQSMVPASRRVGCLSDGTLYTVDSERLRAFVVADGTRRWSQPVAAELGDPVRGYGMQVTRSTVLLGYHGGLAAFAVADGSHRWTVSPGGLGWVYPAVAHGRLYVGSPGPVYAYERRSRPSRLLDPEPRVDWRARGPAFCSWPVVAGSRVVVADREPLGDETATNVWAYGRDGERAWRTRVRGTGRAPAVTPDGTVVVSTGEEPSTVVALDVEDGSVRWEQAVTQYVREPVVAGGVVLVAGSPDELAEDEVVRAYDAETGESLWARRVEGRVERVAAVGGRVYVGTDAGRVVALG
ncbi:PQQ-binding-like beta-propeller repeat protein [Salinigranum sp.]|uniref:outer membrane protein assembly factor BamB family protein n=1 Tax=Salinigranum sp. TaxID=1966351 RepID=UPI00356536F8